MKILHPPREAVFFQLTNEEYKALIPKLDLVLPVELKNQNQAFYAYAKGIWLMLVVESETDHPPVHHSVGET